MAKIVLSFAYQGFRLPLNYKFKQLFLIYELFFYYFYQGKSLPKAYAEAVVMMSASGNEAWRHLSRYFLVNPEYEWRFRQWQETMREGYYDASFKGTFWDYYARHFTPSHTS